MLTTTTAGGPPSTAAADDERGERPVDGAIPHLDDHRRADECEDGPIPVPTMTRPNPTARRRAPRSAATPAGVRPTTAATTPTAISTAKNHRGCARDCPPRRQTCRMSCRRRGGRHRPTDPYRARPAPRASTGAEAAISWTMRSVRLHGLNHPAQGWSRAIPHPYRACLLAPPPGTARTAPGTSGSSPGRVVGPRVRDRGRAARSGHLAGPRGRDGGARGDRAAGRRPLPAHDRPGPAGARTARRSGRDPRRMTLYRPPDPRSRLRVKP